MKVKIDHYNFLNHVLSDLCVNFYVRGAMDAGLTEEEALKKFTTQYVIPDLENPEDILMAYIRLKKLLIRE